MSCGTHTASHKPTDGQTETRVRSDTHGHQVFHHIHVRQRVDLRHFVGVAVDFVQTRQRVSTVDVHGARATDSCGPDRNRIRPETQQNRFKHNPLVSSPSLQERLKVSVPSISFLILMSASRTIGPQLRDTTDAQSTDKHSGPAGGRLDLRVEVDLVRLHARFVSGGVRIPAVDLELLDSGLSRGRRRRLREPHRLERRRTALTSSVHGRNYTLMTSLTLLLLMKHFHQDSRSLMNLRFVHLNLRDSNLLLTSTALMHNNGSNMKFVIITIASHNIDHSKVSFIFTSLSNNMTVTLQTVI